MSENTNGHYLAHVLPSADQVSAKVTVAWSAETNLAHPLLMARVKLTNV